MARVVAVLVQEVTQAKRSAPYLEMLTLAPFCNLRKKLLQPHRREQLTSAQPRRFPKSRALCVPYDQLAALHLNHFVLNYRNLCAQEHLQVQTILSKFQEQVLNLTDWIRFS
jgi:hypothetical protein